MLWPRWREMWRRFLVNEGFIPRPEPDPEEPLGYSHSSECFYDIHAVRADWTLQRPCTNRRTFDGAAEEADRRAVNPSAGTIAYVVVNASGFELYRADVVRSHGER